MILDFFLDMGSAIFSGKMLTSVSNNPYTISNMDILSNHGWMHSPWRPSF